MEEFDISMRTARYYITEVNRFLMNNYINHQIYYNNTLEKYELT